MRVISGRFKGRKLISPTDLGAARANHPTSSERLPSFRHSPAVAGPSSAGSALPAKQPSTSVTHPMGDREKLALFNALGALAGDFSVFRRVLDCYCGSGALGLEALSRGAREVVFVDQNRLAISATQQNISALGIRYGVEIIKSSVKNYTHSYLADISSVNHSQPDHPASSQSDSLKDPHKFDLIFADPPYDQFSTTVADLANLPRLLNPGGFLVISHPQDISPAGLFALDPSSSATSSPSPSDLGIILRSTKSYARARITIFEKLAEAKPTY